MSTRAQASEIAAAMIKRSKQRSGIKDRTEARANKERIHVPVSKKSSPPMSAAKASEKPKKASAPAKEFPLCACGCNERTRGGVYRPGHDSKHRSAQAGPKVMPICACGCKEQTKGGRFRPGHDAKYHSAIAAQKKADEAAAIAKVAKPRGPVRLSQVSKAA